MGGDGMKWGHLRRQRGCGKGETSVSQSRPDRPEADSERIRKTLEELGFMLWNPQPEKPAKQEKDDRRHD